MLHTFPPTDWYWIKHRRRLLQVLHQSLQAGRWQKGMDCQIQSRIFYHDRWQIRQCYVRQGQQDSCHSGSGQDLYHQGRADSKRPSDQKACGDQV